MPYTHTCERCGTSHNVDELEGYCPKCRARTTNTETDPSAESDLSADDAQDSG